MNKKKTSTVGINIYFTMKMENEKIDGSSDNFPYAETLSRYQDI